MEESHKRDHENVLNTFEEMRSKKSRHILENHNFQVNVVTPITQTIIQESLEAFSRNLLNNSLPQMQNSSRQLDLEIPDIQSDRFILDYYNWGG